jgi:hypothetical protein
MPCSLVRGFGETYRLHFQMKMEAIFSSETLVTTYKTTIDMCHGGRCLAAFLLAVTLHVVYPIITMTGSKVHGRVSRFWHVIKAHVMRKLCRRLQQDTTSDLKQTVIRDVRFCTFSRLSTSQTSFYPRYILTMRHVCWYFRAVSST